MRRRLRDSPLTADDASFLATCIEAPAGRPYRLQTLAAYLAACCSGAWCLPRLL